MDAPVDSPTPLAPDKQTVFLFLTPKFDGLHDKRKRTFKSCKEAENMHSSKRQRSRACSSVNSCDRNGGIKEGSLECNDEIKSSDKTRPMLNFQKNHSLTKQPYDFETTIVGYAPTLLSQENDTSSFHPFFDQENTPELFNQCGIFGGLTLQNEFDKENDNPIPGGLYSKSLFDTTEFPREPLGGIFDTSVFGNTSSVKFGELSDFGGDSMFGTDESEANPTVIMSKEEHQAIIKEAMERPDNTDDAVSERVEVKEQEQEYDILRDHMKVK
jgi:hypothetical protein